MIFALPKHKIDKALIVCSGPSAGLTMQDGLPELPGVSIFGVNQAILTMSFADYWVCGCGCAAGRYDGRAKYHVVVCGPEKYDRYKKGLGGIPGDSYIAERNPNAVGFVLDGIKLCKRNAGFTAVNLAVVLGAKKIAVLGFDGSTNKWYHEHKHNDRHGTEEKSRRKTFSEDWGVSAEQMMKLDVEIRNGSPNSHCTEWLRCEPQEAINWIKG